jgi:hypothetical protein
LAYLSAPTFRAEAARAESFGARALTDFKNDPLYTVSGDDESNHKYPLDLANQEGMLGSHVVDKHVGKTDEQLEQRLRDQRIVRPSGIRPEAVSSFGSLADAQRYTQALWMNLRTRESTIGLRATPDPTRLGHFS